jgi:hypothetical protein
MNYNQANYEHAVSPEQRLGIILAEYDQALMKNVDNHAEMLQPIPAIHEESLLSRMREGVSDGRLERELSFAGRQVEHSVTNTSNAVGNTINQYGQVFEDVIPGVDHRVWEKVQSQARMFGPASHYTQEALSAASTRTSRSAMHAALDNLVWEKVQSQARMFGPASHYTQEALSAASTRTSQALFKRQVEQQSAAKGGRAHTGAFNTEDFINDTFRRRQGTHSSAYDFSRNSSRTGYEQRGARPNDGSHTGSRQSSDRTRPEAPKAAPTRNLEVERVVAIAVSRDKSFSWLRTTDAGEVQRVINTVRQLRQQAQSKGAEITDRDIYLRYRRLADKPAEEKNVRIMKSYQILEALMGGYKGKLPF